MTYCFVEAKERQLEQILDLFDNSSRQPDATIRNKLATHFTTDRGASIYCICENTREARVEAFILMTHFDDMSFIECLVIDSHMRGKGLGGILLDWVATNCQNKVILETDVPLDTLSRRRVRYYKSHGFVLNDSLDYKKPPAEGEAHPHPMRIMSYPAPLEPAGFPALRSTLYHKIYDRIYVG